MTRRKDRQARRNLALAAGWMEPMEERVTRLGFASVSRVEAARREVELCATSEALCTRPSCNWLSHCSRSTSALNAIGSASGHHVGSLPRD
jgi:hypothetical protein